MKIQVKVTPNSKTEEVIKEGNTLLVKIKEPPKEIKANKAVIKLLAEYLKVSQKQIVISSGFKNRNKVVEVSETQTPNLKSVGGNTRYGGLQGRS